MMNVAEHVTLVNMATTEEANVQTVVKSPERHSVDLEVKKYYLNMLEIMRMIVLMTCMTEVAVVVE